VSVVVEFVLNRSEPVECSVQFVRVDSDDGLEQSAQRRVVLAVQFGEQLVELSRNRLLLVTKFCVVQRLYVYVRTPSDRRTINKKHLKKCWTHRARQLSMLFLFPVKDGKLSTGVNAIFNASCYG